MSIKDNLSRNALYLFAVIILTGGIYSICDYYLYSVAKELMLNWSETEAIAIEEGNLLTSITKTQRFLISSSYIKGVKLVKILDNSIESKIEFGEHFLVAAEDVKDLTPELMQKRIGFLHQRAFYQIPKKDNLVLVFDVQSGFLTFLFGVSSSLIIMLIAYLIWSLQKLEHKEAKKREELLKLAINDLLLNDSPSKVLEQEIPDLVKWWNVKKNEINEAKQAAIDQQSKILLGDIAARVVHDIRGALRNIREISKIASGLTDTQKNIIQKSLDKVSKISQGLLDGTKYVHSEDNKLRLNTNIVDVIQETVLLKQNQFGSTIAIKFESDVSNVESILDPSQLDRTVSNLIDNAVEASQINSTVLVKVLNSDKKAEIHIIDSGKGIPKENLNKIGVKGFTEGKSNGTGLGIFYARRFVEDLGGQFLIQSEINKGTNIMLSIPTLDSNKEETIEINSSRHLLILEDQLANRLTIKYKFDTAKVSAASYSMFSTPSELEQWLASNNNDFKLYSDYFLENDKGEKFETGIQVIKRLGLADKAILFTSAADNPAVIQAASEIGVPVLSKSQFFNAKIINGENNA